MSQSNKENTTNIINISTVCQEDIDSSSFQLIEDPTFIFPFPERKKDCPPNNITVKIEKLIKDITEKIGEIRLCAKCLDLLKLAIVIFYADFYTAYSDTRPDEKIKARAWNRNFKILIDVYNVDLLRNLAPTLESVLSFGMRENVKLYFVKKNDNILIKPKKFLDHPFNEMALFSGGLDSFTYLVTSINKTPPPLFFSIERGNLRSIQQTLLRSVSERMEKSILHFSLFTKKRNLKNSEFEKYDLGKSLISNLTARSFLFLSAAIISTHELGIRKIKIPENGIISLNLPISSGRQHTRTTHPYFLKKLEGFYSKYYKEQLHIINPFRDHLKSFEMRMISNDGFSESIRNTRSCFNPRTSGHCGYCYGCIIRRLSLIASNLEEFDGMYEADIFRNPVKSSDYEAQDILIDLIDLSTDFLTLSNTKLLINHPDIIFPEITEEELTKYYNLYRAFSKEIIDIIKRRGTKKIKRYLISQSS